jgi:lactate/malate dehydrogenase, NAD binding domain
MERVKRLAAHFLPGGAGGKVGQQSGRHNMSRPSLITHPPACCAGRSATSTINLLSYMSRHRAQFKVAVLGAAGGIGQPLSLLLKQSPLISELSLYDVANTAGVACDISHISTASNVKGYTGPTQLGDALTGAQLVIIPAGWAVS